MTCEACDVKVGQVKSDDRERLVGGEKIAVNVRNGWF